MSEADCALLRRARREQRILLTRDRALAQAQSAHTLPVEARALMEQLAEVEPASAGSLYDQVTYCAACDKLYWKGNQYERIVAFPGAVSERHARTRFEPKCARAARHA
jgi:uncharacterized protein with PIN domain